VLPTAATYLTSTVEQPHHPGLDRRRFLVTLLAGVLVGPLVAEGQAGKTYRIGWLAYGWTEGAEFTAPEFVQKLNELQQKFVIEFRGHPDEKRLPGLARELVQTGVDVIVANGTIAAQAAHSVTHTVPIVFLISGDPVAARLVESLGHPGGNVTGPSAASPEFAAKRLELFKEAVPRLARVAVLIGGTDFDVRLAREIEVASPAAGVRIQRFKASVAEDFDSVFAAIVRARVDGLLVVNRPQLRRRQGAPGRAGAPRATAEHVRGVALRRSRWPDGLRAKLPGDLPARCRVRGEDSKGRQPRGSARRAAEQIRAGHQPQDRQGPRPHDPAVAAGAGGSGHRVVRRPAR
jgi:putative tryptophan/tyrosine transport system substrate-binding protein